MFYLGIFGVKLEKAIVLWLFHISTLKFFQTKVCQKIKFLKFGTKNVLTGYFGLECHKIMSNLKSGFSNLLTCKVSSKNKKFSNMGPKITYLGIFGLQFNKNYYQTFKQHTWICETIKFHPKQNKNLGPKILYLDLWLECWKILVIFLINALQIV